MKLKQISILLALFVSAISSGQHHMDTVPVKNVVLFIGDGMGVSQVYAAISVSPTTLNIERSHFFGYAKTYSANNYTTDSGAGATAMATGVKTYNKAISVDTSTVNLNRITELVKRKGLSTGVVATCEVTHATPASFLTNNVSRYNNSELAYGIAYSGADLIIGGGAKLFDSLGLFDTIRTMGYHVVPNFTEIDVSNKAPVISLPYDKHPPRMLDGRGDFLPDATEIALNKLGSNSFGFFLMVEGSQIDWAGHNNDIDYAVTEVIDLDNAIGKAYDFADKNPGTLIIVTADHETGGLALINGSIENNSVEAVFATKGHTGVMVPVFAYGAGASNFSEIMENTEIFTKIASLLGVEIEVDESIVEGR